jgi:hypothetical protein
VLGHGGLRGDRRGTVTATFHLTGPALVFDFNPDTVPTSGFSTGCNGGPAPAKSWFYALSIQNVSAAPITISSWTLTTQPPGIIDETYDAARFVQRFGTATIPAGARVNSNFLCVYLNVGSSVTIFHTFTTSSTTYTTPLLNLLP